MVPTFCYIRICSHQIVSNQTCTLSVILIVPLHTKPGQYHTISISVDVRANMYHCWVLCGSFAHSGGGSSSQRIISWIGIEALLLQHSHQGPTGTRYPTRTRSFFQYPIHTRFVFKIIGYFGYRVFQKTIFLTWKTLSRSYKILTNIILYHLHLSRCQGKL